MCIVPPMDASVRATALPDLQGDQRSTQSTSGSESEEEDDLGDATPSFAADEMHQCRFQHPPCTQPRRARPDGTLHEFCEGHRRQASHTQRRQQQRDRLLRVLISALQQQEQNGDEGGQQRRRRRPRLVLLGNQGTLILGVVLSERGDLQHLQNSMP